MKIDEAIERLEYMSNSDNHCGNDYDCFLTLTFNKNIKALKIGISALWFLATYKKKVKKCIGILENEELIKHCNPMVTSNYVLRSDVIKLIKEELGK